MMKKIMLFGIGIFLGIFLIFSIPAQAEEGLKLTSTVFETKVKEGDQIQRKTISESEMQSGMEVFYSLTHKNIGNKPVSDVVITDFIPKNLEYLSASISKSEGLSADLSVSVDGGKTYGALSDLTVTSAENEPRAAEPKEVTHVRWLIKSTVNPEELIYVSIRTKVK